jgi:c-di-GMP-binding flagellar brake protein YcgR
MTDGSSSGELVDVSLKTLRLRPGLFLKMQRMYEGATVHEAQFVAAIESKGVMLTPCGTDSLKTEIIIGEEYLIHGFTGQSDFSFTASALNVFKTPFAHVLFAYPAAAKAKKVRHSMRMKTALPATISPCGQSNPLEVSVIDLSVTGAMILSPRSIGVIGGLFDLVFPIKFDDVDAKLNIVTKLRHNNLAENEGRKIGLSFENLSSEHKLLLSRFVGRIAEEQLNGPASDCLAEQQS